MDHFHYVHDRLYCEEVALDEIAERFGTPCHVYSRATIERHWQAFSRAFAGHEHLICYAVKANPNLAILHLLAHLGAGFDIVSGGELERVLRAGGKPDRVVFSGVGKRAAEMRRALEVGIRCFNVESEAELRRLNRVAGEVGRPTRYRCASTRTWTLRPILTSPPVWPRTSSAFPCRTPSASMPWRPSYRMCGSRGWTAISVPN